MLIMEALELIDQESETMVIEWADTQDGYGVEVINKSLNTLFDNNGIEQEHRKLIVIQLKSLILLDMTINGW